MFSLFSILCIGVTLFSKVESQNFRPYHSRIEKELNGLKIESNLADGSSYDGIHFMWVDTSIFNDTGHQAEDCSAHDDNYCLKWGDKAEIQIWRLNEYCEVYDMKTTMNKDISIAFNLEGVHLYGGGEMSNQTWPIQKSPLNHAPYVTFDSNVTQSILERYWLTSKGQYMYVDETVPLFVTHNDTALIFVASLRDPYIRILSETTLKFTFCELENVKVAHQHAIANVFEKPTKLPDFRMVQYPIWSTWAKYKINISESVVLEYANGITNHGFPNSALEIDDMWETCYGSFTIDKERFPDMRGLVDELKRRGFRVTMWVHPFINEDCGPLFFLARDLGFLVRNKDGSVITNWWNGEAGAIDFTNSAAFKWWVDRLKSLQNETGLDSFKFDAGEMGYLPQPPILSVMSNDHPDTYIKEYVKAANEFGNMIEVRTARGIQGISPFVRMMDRETKWTGYRALDTLVPTVLQLNIIGYPFVLPDMIGGNGYREDELTEEMYIRWLQISIFMPALQFSIPPWDFSSDAIEITRKYIKLHALYAEKIYNLMKKCVEDGTPVNLPLWWIDPHDAATYEVDSEFLLGEDTLVAPVIKQGAVTRNIYLPKGTWRDENNLSTPLIEGPIMLYDYPAKIDILPYFTRVDGQAHISSTIQFTLLNHLIPKMLIIFFVTFILYRILWKKLKYFGCSRYAVKFKQLNP